MRTSISRTTRGFFAAVVIGAAACGALAAPASAAPARNPLAKLTADQIAKKAITDLQSASSFHVYQSQTVKGQTVSISLSISHHGCAGLFNLGSMGKMAILEIGSTSYLQPSDQLWETLLGVPASELPSVSGKWLEGSSPIGNTPDLCAWKQLKANFGLQSTGLVKGRSAKVSGHWALQLKGKKGMPSYYVTVSSKPEFVTTNSKLTGPLTYSAYNAKVTLTAPPASDILTNPPTPTSGASAAARSLLHLITR